jgi:hypothetical protein
MRLQYGIDTGGTGDAQESRQGDSLRHTVIGVARKAVIVARRIARPLA